MAWAVWGGGLPLRLEIGQKYGRECRERARCSDDRAGPNGNRNPAGQEDNHDSERQYPLQQCIAFLGRGAPAFHTPDVFGVLLSLV